MNETSSADTVELPIPDLTQAVEPPRPFSSLINVDLAAASDRGRVRPNNEDHHLVVRFGRSWETLFTNLPAGEVPARSAETGYGMVIADAVQRLRGPAGTTVSVSVEHSATRQTVDLVITRDNLVREGFGPR